MAAHHHGHSHHHSAGQKGHDNAASRHAMLFALLLTFAFALIEVAGGLWAHSLALISDGGHMLTDAAGLGLGVFAQIVSRRPPSRQNTYGYARAEVIAAFVNALIMLAIVIWITVEAVERIRVPQAVDGKTVIVIGAAGMIANVLVAWILSQAASTLNVKGALIHVMGDLIGSVAAVIAGSVVYFTGWTPIDPLLSLIVALLILISTCNLLRQSTRVLMEGTPAHLSYDEIGQALSAQAGVLGVHDLHVWHMSSERVALSAHLAIADSLQWPDILTASRRMLAKRFNIDHVTLQPSWASIPQGARIIPLAVVGDPKSPLH